MELKMYQVDAKEDIIRCLNRILESEDSDKDTVTLESVMGSGKTHVAAAVIEELNKNEKYSFIWLTPGKGELDIQSRNKLFELITTGNCFLADDLIGKNEIDIGDIVVINYEKINRENNKLNQEGDNASLKTILENTRQDHKIILIVDESHNTYDSEKTIRIVSDVIKPAAILEVSATPKINSSRSYHVSIDIGKVIGAGMVKKDGVINPGLENIDNLEDKYSTQIVIAGAINQQDLIINAYKHIHIDIMPLVLIQLADSEKGDDSKEEVLEELSSQGYTIDNGAVSVWTAKEKINIEDIESNGNKVRFLIFKQALVLGWNCPRAHILVILRESKNKSFRIQTLGRIYRTAEGKHYGDPVIDRAYMFTNMSGVMFNIEKDAFTSSPNRLKDMSSSIKSEYKMTTLKSFYKVRETQGDITAKIRERLYVLNALEKILGISLNGDYASNINKATKSGMDFSTKYKESIMIDKELSFRSLNSEEDIIADKSIAFKLSDTEIYYAFLTILKAHMQGFPPARSIQTVKEALYNVIEICFGIKSTIESQRIVVNNVSLFGKVLDEAISKYKSDKPKEESENKKENRVYDWSIPKKDYYSSDVYEEVDYKKYAMSKCFLEKTRSNPERDFEKLLETNDNISWWWKNGKSAEQYFGIRYVDSKGKERTFYPDYIIYTTNGKIIIVDTKSGRTADDAGPRSNALRIYLAHNSTKDQPLDGGIVVNNEVFVGPEYKIEDRKNWIPISEIL